MDISAIQTVLITCDC